MLFSRLLGGSPGLLFGLYFFLLQALFDLIVQSPLNKDNLSPLMANHRAEAGADDRIPPSQECSPHPGRKTTQKQTKQPQKNRPKMVKMMASQTCTEITKSQSHTATAWY